MHYRKFFRTFEVKFDFGEHSRAKNSSKKMEKARNQFWEYLQSSGAEDALAAALHKLYQLEKKPENVVQFLLNNLDPEMARKVQAQAKEIETLKKELLQLKKKFGL